LREKGDIESEINDIPDGFHLTPVNIHGITDGLKGKKRYAHREDDAGNIKTGSQQIVTPPGKNINRLVLGLKNPVKHIGQEIGVFEIGKHSQVDQETDGYIELS